MAYKIITRNTLTQASKKGRKPSFGELQFCSYRKPYLFPQKKCRRVLSIISHRRTLIVRRENPHFFGFVYHVSCEPCFVTKNKIRCIDAPKYAFTHRNLPDSEKYI